jgi:hypothetical protein
MLLIFRKQLQVISFKPQAARIKQLSTLLCTFFLKLAALLTTFAKKEQWFI